MSRPRSWSSSPQGEPLAGLISVLRPQKDPLLAVRAAARLEPGRDRLAIVGNGELAEAVRSEIERLGVGERVRWFPFEGGVGRYLAALDVFVLPSAWEAFPISLLEAMACAVPVVATDVGGVGEAVEDGVTGRLVAPGDEAALAAALAELLGDGDLRGRMGADAERALRRALPGRPRWWTPWRRSTASCWGRRMSAPRMSVVIATKGRPDDLRETLASLARLDPRPARAAGRRRRRGTLGRAGRSAGDGARSVRYLHTPPGLTLQRNSRLRAAGGDVVVFLDDDVRVAPDLFARLGAAYADPRWWARPGA